MRKFILKEDFNEDYNKLMGIAKRVESSELRKLLGELNKLPDKEKELDKLVSKKVNKGELSGTEIKKQSELKKEISSLKSKLDKAKSLGKRLEAEAEQEELSKEKKEEHKNIKEKFEKKAKAEPETNLRKIRTGLPGGRLANESYNWKERVKFYLNAI